jgi:ribosomal protein L44E
MESQSHRLVAQPVEAANELRNSSQSLRKPNRAGSKARKCPDKEPEQPSKRARITLACEECRTRKVRCDGVQPGMFA